MSAQVIRPKHPGYSKTSIHKDSLSTKKTSTKVKNKATKRPDLAVPDNLGGEGRRAPKAEGSITGRCTPERTGREKLRKPKMRIRRFLLVALDSLPCERTLPRTL